MSRRSGFARSEQSRWLSIEVVPLATANDATDAVKDMSFVGYPNPKAKLIAERRVDGPTVPGCSMTWAFEQETSVRAGGEGFSRRLYAAAGPVVFGVTASALGAEIIGVLAPPGR